MADNAKTKSLNELRQEVARIVAQIEESSGSKASKMGSHGLDLSVAVAKLTIGIAERLERISTELRD